MSYKLVIIIYKQILYCISYIGCFKIFDMDMVTDYWIYHLICNYYKVADVIVLKTMEFRG